MPRSLTPFRFDPAAPDAETREAWAVLRGRAAPTPFGDLAYAVATAEAFGLEPVGVAVRDAGGAFAAGVVAYVRRWGPYRLGVVPPFTAHTPVLLAEPLSEARVHAGTSALGALLEALLPVAHAHALHLDVADRDVRPALWSGWSARPLYTYRLPLDAPETSRAFWSASARRTYRNARDAYSVAETDDVGIVVRLGAGSYERHDRRLPGGPDRVRRLLQKLHAAGRVRVVVATPAEGPPEAAVAVLRDRDVATYWLAGSVPGAAMTVLIGELLARLHEDACTTFDFVGANTASIAEFKRKFGAELTPYFRLTRILRPELRLLQSRLG